MPHKRGIPMAAAWQYYQCMVSFNFIILGKSMIMDLSPMHYYNESGQIFYKMYHDLPIGAVLVDSKMTVISSNKRMCEYFPYCEHGPEGMPLCALIHCENIGKDNSVSAKSEACRKCKLRDSVMRIIKEKSPTSNSDVKYTYCSEDIKNQKWFNVSGFSIEYGSEIYAVLFFNDITEYEQHEKDIEKKLEFDYPTKALNKYGLTKYLNALTGNKSVFTVCMIDFDDFKKINDKYGHIVGDRVLSHFSSIARRTIRSEDILARYGGEEFVFIFMDTCLDDAVNIISRVQEELRDYFEEVLSQPVTFSAGAVYISGKSELRYQNEDLIKMADGLLYEAKSNGKNQIVARGEECYKRFFDGEPDATQMDR